MPLRLTERAQSRAALANWSQPVLADLIAEIYARNQALALDKQRLLANAHSRFWQALLAGDQVKFGPLRQMLESLGKREDLSAGLLDSIDDCVLEDLVEVILARFLRSPQLAKAYCQIAVEAARDLGALRGAAKNAALAAPASSAKPRGPFAPIPLRAGAAQA